MARNINLTISSQLDGTKRDQVDDLLVHMVVDYIGKDGQAHHKEQDRYVIQSLLDILALPTNNPNNPQHVWNAQFKAGVKFQLQQLTYQLERVFEGIDEVDVLNG